MRKSVDFILVLWRSTLTYSLAHSSYSSTALSLPILSLSFITLLLIPSYSSSSLLLPLTIKKNHHSPLTPHSQSLTALSSCSSSLLIYITCSSLYLPLLPFFPSLPLLSCPPSTLLIAVSSPLSYSSPHLRSSSPCFLPCVFCSCLYLRIIFFVNICRVVVVVVNIHLLE